QHDIHYADSAHNQTHARNRKHPDEQHAGKLVPNVRDGIGGEDGEVIRFVGGHFAPPPQELADLVNRFRYVVVRGRFDTDPVLLQFWVQLPECAQGKEDFVVFRILSAAEYRLDLLGNSDHGKELPLNINLSSQRVVDAEQFLGS